jgi:hypothetical protein
MAAPRKLDHPTVLRRIEEQEQYQVAIDARGHGKHHLTFPKCEPSQTLWVPQNVKRSSCGLSLQLRDFYPILS